MALDTAMGIWYFSFPSLATPKKTWGDDEDAVVAELVDAQR